MAQIRDTIELLTKLLRENGTSVFKAEVFRQAKFNSNEAVVPMWRLLFELIYYCNYGKIDDVAWKAADQFTTKEMVVFVKRELQQRGFHSHAFAALPRNMSQGSRELLLALGWLLCKEGLIDQFMEHCSSPIDEDNLGIHKVEADCKKNPLKKITLNPSSSPSSKVQQLLMLNGKLRLSLRSMFALQIQKHRQQHKIHVATQGVSLSPYHNHLSIMEVNLLRNPDLLKKVLYLLEEDNDRLHDLLKWKEQEDIFWKWMESVLDLKLKETPRETETTSPTVYNIPPDGVEQMLEARHSLQTAIIKYESMVDQLERLWETKRSSISERELDSLIASLDMEISLQKAKLTLHSTRSLIRERAQKPQLSFVNAVQKKSSNVRRTCPDPFEEASRLQSERSQDMMGKISSLEDHVESLQKRVQRQQNMGRERLDNIASRLPDLICIPPLGHREYV